MRVQMDLDIGEKVYGLGERFTPFVRNGQTVDMWNEDGGTCREISYKSIPFCLSDKGYGVLVDNQGEVSCEICCEAVARVQFSVAGERLDFYFHRRTDAGGHPGNLYGPRGAAGAAAGLVFRPVAVHLLHHLLPGSRYLFLD